MASGMQISIGNEQAANDWLREVQAINEEYRIAMEEAANTLKSMNEFASGTLVDDIVNLGNDLLNAGQTIFQGIDEIADTVGNIVVQVGNFVDEAKDKIKEAFNNIFGR